MTQVTGEWLTAEAAQDVCRVLEDAGFAAWFVGGCVRNALLGVEVSDLDISTDARPERVMELARAAGMRAVPTGIEHGTVTVIHQDQPFEITTFRRDVETDGRRAVVAFADTLEEDAQRRDFTMNALYADRRGAVTDPVGGLNDLAARQFRFIGDAEARIREDYLRILRFFRFFAWYGVDLDAEGLAASAALSAGIETLSAERVTAEMLKLLSAPDPLRAVAAMEQAGVLARFLPGASARVLGPYLMAEDGDPVARLVALGGDRSALRLSKAQAKAADAYAAAQSSAASAGELGYRLGAEMATRAVSLRAATLEQPVSPSDLEAARAAANAVFPVKAADLPDTLKGAEIGDALKRLEAAWIEGRFQPTKEALMALL